MAPKATPTPDYAHEGSLLAAGARFVAGVDEAGRGPLAGPVTAAAVVLDATCIPEGLNDSKVLARGRREELLSSLEGAAQVGIGWASVEEIDALNILNATHFAMRRAIEALPNRPCHVLIDGNSCPPNLPCPSTPLVGGDGLCVSIAAASIVAKVARDRVMAELDAAYPGYGWAKNAGYATVEHRRALQHLGVTPHHRRSFAPVHQMLCN
ncbi:ribonuclease HII [Roseibacterium sp. SDUM158017]|uniref:ribonuclease HII n=1 Tax=Roseicyclus salinarum TaxID=3036773 RepID=UPI002415258E|nr:ribonuclease HII [Roseibacterium sp. SDUM158017]MDG4646834.1 ribonuclease HII [Roseibacterium sp. SDUM158017]